MAVAVAVMKVGIVRVFVAHGGMTVQVRVRLGDRAVMTMLVVVVMNVLVFMLDLFVAVLMLMPFREVEPEAKSHQDTRCAEPPRQFVSQQNDGQRRPDERSKGEIGPGPRCPEMAETQHEEHQTDADPEQADQSASKNQFPVGKQSAQPHGNPQIYAASDDALDDHQLDGVSR